MRMGKGQVGMEYIVSYGWAILVIMLAVLVLFYLGVLNPKRVTPGQCTFQPGFICVATRLQASTSQLYIVMGQRTGRMIVVNGISCTQNASSEFAKSGIISYGGTDNVTIDSGGQAALATPDDAPWLAVRCVDAKGSIPADTAVGAVYNGRIYINYTEYDTNMTRVAVGAFSTKYEA